MVSEGRREERSTGLTPIRTTRRTMVRGAAWSVPLVTVAAPAAYAGPSQCTVVGSVQVGPLVPMTVRAICTAQSQFLNPGTSRSVTARMLTPGTAGRRWMTSASSRLRLTACTSTRTRQRLVGARPSSFLASVKPVAVSASRSRIARRCRGQRPQPSSRLRSPFRRQRVRPDPGPH